jgi:hypothetical protein
MSGLHNSGRNKNTKIGNKYFVNVAKFKYSGKIVTNQNFGHKEIQAHLTEGTFIAIRCRIFCFPVCYLKTKEK